ncbi:hypothetical protein K0I63_17305 [Shewanella rhizosphaerae]|uniref:hypothetical protein n=1 Tax=Shewanella rhizosphaerae TaxID=2864207 RepID=UPI001C657CB5|nr:hypothetical protein [Shewanella rhizosphaerae]QYK12473.1 hypothetical protein K0I63_17305 [Shewanella rhizosphaerae]
MDDTLTIKPYQTLAYVIITLTASLFIIKQLFLSAFDDQWCLFIGYCLAMLIWAGALLKQEIVFTQRAIAFINIPLTGRASLGKETQIAYRDITGCHLMLAGLEIATNTEAIRVSLRLNDRLISCLSDGFERHGLQATREAVQKNLA